MPTAAPRSFPCAAGRPSRRRMGHQRRFEFGLNCGNRAIPSPTQSPQGPVPPLLYTRAPLVRADTDPPLAFGRLVPPFPPSRSMDFIKTNPKAFHTRVPQTPPDAHGPPPHPPSTSVSMGGHHFERGMGGGRPATRGRPSQMAPHASTASAHTHTNPTQPQTPRTHHRPSPCRSSLRRLVRLLCGL